MSSVILTPLPNTILFICWVCEVACQFYSVAISANPTLGAYYLLTEIDIAQIPTSLSSLDLLEAEFYPKTKRPLHREFLCEIVCLII